MNFSIKHFFILFCSALCAQNGIAQDLLTLENAVKIALENNFEIKISKNNLEINNSSASYGNAGMYPKITANIIDNNSIQNTTQTRADGTVTTLDNAKNNSFVYGVGLDWTIFDGFKMFAKLSQLQVAQKVGQAKLNLTIITKISDVTSTYYTIVQQQQQLAALNSTLVISNQRLNLAQNRFTIGKASRLEVLNAQVDLNADTTALLQQKEQLANVKIVFNQILARDLSIDFIAAKSISIDDKLVLPALIALAQKQNPELEAQMVNKKIAELQLKQVKADRYPVVRINSAYNFSQSEASLGFITQSSGRGLNYGFTATLNIFDGFAQRRNEKIAALQVANAQLAINQQMQLMQATLKTSFQTYVTNLELTKLEQKNEAIAKQNLQITLDKFRIGSGTALEFRAAQLNYINAKVRNSNAQFNAKLSEIALKELAGTITL